MKKKEVFIIFTALLTLMQRGMGTDLRHDGERVARGY